MWGNILTEVSFQPNFNITFSNNRSDILIHLTQWQYWWWFWFTFLWVLYYLILAKTARTRLLKFRPRIATTTRPRGKWGDLLVCLIPVSWCINILINSNFLLKLIEWQNESSLFTIRVRGKQWYWVYKFDLKNITDILSAPKNIGRNKWTLNFFGELETADSYLTSLRVRSQSIKIKEYWSEVLDSTSKIKKYNSTSPQERYRKFIFNNFNNFKKILQLNKINKYINNNVFNNLDDKINYFLYDSNSIYEYFNNVKKSSWTEKLNIKKKKNCSGFSVFFKKKNRKINQHINNGEYFYLDRRYQRQGYKNILKKLINPLYNLNYNYYNVNNYDDFFEYTRLLRKNEGIKTPFRLVKLPLFQYKFNGNDIFKLSFNEISDSIEPKPMSDSTLLNFKQKRYRRRNKVNPDDLITLSKKPENLFFVRNNYMVPNKFEDKFYDILDEALLLDTVTNILKKYILKAYDDEPIIGNETEKFLYERALKNDDEFYKFVLDASDKFLKNPEIYKYSYLVNDFSRSLKKNKKRFDEIPVVYSKRLLRTQRTLVLPAHVNITAITNSYDVVHSWFIPGLGIKLDCIPGRATHHTFFIDNVGFYYGQCAEVCGRYHHHMPIRICALPFEHFLVWWNSFGLPRLLFKKTVSKDFKIKHSLRKYVW